MKTYMLTRAICAPITLISLVVAIVINYCGNDLICNILLGVFGSSLLTWISAVIAYRTVREEAIMEYMKALRIYRRKYRRLISSKSENEWFQRREEQEGYFDECHRAYSKTFHFRKSKEIPKILNNSFEDISYVQGELNCYGVEYEEYSEKIDRAVRAIEELATRMKYLRPQKKAEKRSDSNGTNGADPSNPTCSITT